MWRAEPSLPEHLSRHGGVLCLGSRLSLREEDKEAWHTGVWIAQHVSAKSNVDSLVTFGVSPVLPTALVFWCHCLDPQDQDGRTPRLQTAAFSEHLLVSPTHIPVRQEALWGGCGDIKPEWV